jgi:hypothetical protein
MIVLFMMMNLFVHGYLKKNSAKFYCQNSPSNPIVRCEYSPNSKFCQMREDLWFCDIGLESQYTPNIPSIIFEPYPSINQNSDPPNQLLLSEKQINSDLYICNLGYPIKSMISNNKTYCLCPPSYYGDYCQYQSERLTVLFQIQTRYSMNPLSINYISFDDLFIQ